MLRRLVPILAPAALFSDNFNRADGALASPWTVVSGSFAIVSGRLKSTVGGGAVVSVRPNCSIEANVTYGSDFVYLSARRVDASNRVIVQLGTSAIILAKRVNGVTTDVQTAVVTYVPGQKLKCICSGVYFSVFYNHVQVISPQAISDAVLQTSSNVGVVGDTNSYFDNFAVRRV